MLIATAIVSHVQTYTVLHSFDSTDGAQSYSGLVQARDGYLYGTTGYGGANEHGTVFKISPAGMLTTLYSFCSQSNCTDGDLPSYATLIQATDGNLYGTTQYGGTNGDGTIFEITRGGKLTTIYSFCSQRGCTDSANPLEGLIQASDGDLYGITGFYGANGIGGTVFRIIILAGALTTLHSFDFEDGDKSLTQLAQAIDGNLYGTTYLGGASNGGAIVKITPGGTFITLHSFDDVDTPSERTRDQ